MISVTALPPAILEAIFQHLPSDSIQSASLTTRTWSQVYKQHICRTFSFDLSAEPLLGKTELLQRWEHMNLLPFVHQITINDSGDRSQDGENLLNDLFHRWLPKLSGLKSVSWELSGKSALRGGFGFAALPSGVFLDLAYEDETSSQTNTAVLSAIQNCDNLRSLAVEFSQAEEAILGSLLTATLLSCKGLTSLKIKMASNHSESQEKTPHDAEQTAALHWTAEDVAKLPALQRLDLHYPSLTGEMFEIWARKGNWDSLRTLITHDSQTLECLAGHLPALESLSVNTLEYLPQFLTLQPGINELAVVDLQPSSQPKDVVSELHQILKLPFASRLKQLELQIAQDETESEQSTIDVAVLATSCRELRELTVSITSQQYRNAVGYFCWMDACIESVVRMPNLLRLCIVLPRVIPSGSISIPPEIITLPDVANLWSQLAAHGKTLQELRIIASMTSEKAESDREAAILSFLSPTPSLTFITTPAEKDWDAAQGAYQTSCPELEEAENLLRRGHLSRLSSPPISYSTARRTADDISTIIYKGTIAPKKKIRPMPVWLTPEEEQDRREGPPSQSRRAKRALIRSVGEFTGAWRLPMTETSPRTAEERARSRENGFGGKPGWSKSSLGMRIFYRR